MYKYQYSHSELVNVSAQPGLDRSSSTIRFQGLLTWQGSCRTLLSGFRPPFYGMSTLRPTGHIHPDRKSLFFPREVMSELGIKDKYVNIMHAIQLPIVFCCEDEGE